MIYIDQGYYATMHFDCDTNGIEVGLYIQFTEPRKVLVEITSGQFGTLITQVPY